jgi:hypothetical protein
MVHTYTQKTPNKLYRYYVCVNAHQRGWNTCETRSVSAPDLERAVVDQIRGIITWIMHRISVPSAGPTRLMLSVVE